MSELFQQLMAIYDTAKSGGEIMEMAIALGERVVLQGDERRIMLGGLADALDNCYGDNTLNQAAISWCVPPRTLRSYRQTVRYYGIGTLCQIVITDAVGWAIALDTVRHYPGSPDAAIAFIEKFVFGKPDIGHSEAMHELAIRTGKPAPAAKWLDCEATITAVDTALGTVTLSVGNGVWDVANMVKRRGHVRITEVVSAGVIETPA